MNHYRDSLFKAKCTYCEGLYLRSRFYAANKAKLIEVKKQTLTHMQKAKLSFKILGIWEA